MNNDAKKELIFIPFQDYADFSSTKIMTREYSILYSFLSRGYKLTINVLKPRTFLDKKKIYKNSFEDGTYEDEIYKVLSNSYRPKNIRVFSLKQLFKKREWWIDGYNKMHNQFKKSINCKTIVYSNNPYAYKLLSKLKRQGCYIYFDIMDNFAIHPSFRDSERKAAYKAYLEIFKFADVISANSSQTIDYYKNSCPKEIALVKNGVFSPKAIPLDDDLKSALNKKKTGFKNIACYIGKLGKRIDYELVSKIVDGCPNTLFVVCGPQLRDQKNKKLSNLFEKKNVLYLGSCSSTMVLPLLNECDVLIIPHSIGKSENGGDPLKLYQYLLTRKPIITTDILGVGEFKEIIKISNDVNEWVEFINNGYSNYSNYEIPNSIFWSGRLSLIFDIIEKLG